MTLDAQLLIDGAWRAAQGGATAASVNPADGRTIGRYAAADLTDAHGAIAAARRAFERPDWAQAPRLRQQVMLHWADALERKSDELARLLTLENGKVLAQSRGEMAGAISEAEVTNSAWAPNPSATRSYLVGPSSAPRPRSAP